MILNWESNNQGWKSELRSLKDSSAKVLLDTESYLPSEICIEDGRLSFTLEGRRLSFDICVSAGVVELTDGRNYYLMSHAGEGEEASEHTDSAAGSLQSKMPGKVLAHTVSPGAQVQRGDVLLILEAMKMEHEITAPSDGTVQSFPQQPGARVMPGDLLVNFTPAG